MITRTLGPTSVSIPVVGQGTMGIGGYFKRDLSRNAECVRLLRMGIELGMTLIDTADLYSEGHSEELVGEAVRGHRESVFIATKFSPENSAYEDVIRSAEASLGRLKTDRIDLYQIHWPNYRIPIEDTMRAMERLIEEGKVRYIGVSNLSVNEMRRTQACISRSFLVSEQQEYNLIDRTIEREIIPFCREQKITLIAYSPLMRGKIAANAQKMAVLSGIAEKYDMSIAQLVLNWVTRDPCVVAIPKALNEKHMRENAEAADFKIDPADYDVISKLCASKISYIPTDIIDVAEQAERNVYKTLEEAVENRFHFVPSPEELARQVASGEILKPVRLQLDMRKPDKPRYKLTDGRIRYWAWVIAHKGKAPIPALTEILE